LAEPHIITIIFGRESNFSHNFCSKLCNSYLRKIFTFQIRAELSIPQNEYPTKHCKEQGCQLRHIGLITSIDRKQKDFGVIFFNLLIKTGRLLAFIGT